MKSEHIQSSIEQLDEKEQEIYNNCLNLQSFKSFALFAGAGSGKTRSLVTLLQKIKDEHEEYFSRLGKKIAVITYTNAATDEIKHRLKIRDDYSTIFQVSTIHSFAWTLIQNFQYDIKQWLEKSHTDKIAEINTKLQNRKSDKQQKELGMYQEKLKQLKDIAKFSYNPNGSKFGNGVLHHQQVFKITGEFLETHTLMKQILINRYPIIFIDECQDTDATIINALFKVQEENFKFVLGLFGDIMQKVYAGGILFDQHEFSDQWLVINKDINHRSAKRIIELINIIRDKPLQKPVDIAKPGLVRFFVVNNYDEICKQDVEMAIKTKMGNDVKTLILEHKMAAIRGGFEKFFIPLYDIMKDNKKELLEGIDPNILFLIKQVLPLFEAIKTQNHVDTMNILLDYSVNLRTNQFTFYEFSLLKSLISELEKLINESNSITILELVKKIDELKILEIPIYLKIIIYESVDERNELSIAWHQALNVTFEQLNQYNKYVSDNSVFGTHQGVKGSEFPRVMVIIDDNESGGNQFHYGKYLDCDELSETDKSNITENKDNVIERTKRLFYVTCSRAQESLAIVIYTDQPDKVKQSLLDKNFAIEKEIQLIRNKADWDLLGNVAVNLR